MQSSAERKEEGKERRGREGCSLAGGAQVAGGLAKAKGRGGEVLIGVVQV